MDPAIKGSGAPPVFSGYPAADAVAWQEFRDQCKRVRSPSCADFNAWVTQQGAPPLPNLEFIHVRAVNPHEGAVNLYVYPELAGYTAAPPLGPSGTASIRRSVRRMSPRGGRMNTGARVGSQARRGYRHGDEIRPIACVRGSIMEVFA
jgi:hypothetical protein